MKYLFVFVILVIGFNSMAQSKKEEIAILTNRLDSLNKEYVKDTTYLSNMVETIDRKFSNMSVQYEEAIKKKSTTIKSLNKKNMDLMEELKEMRKSLNTLQLQNKRIKQSNETVKIGNLEIMTEDLGTMDWREATKACADLGNGWRLPTNDELSILYKNKEEIGGFNQNYKVKASVYWSSTDLGGRDFYETLKFAQHPEKSNKMQFLWNNHHINCTQCTYSVRAVRDF